jgi:DNA-directed RNA polymerase subunit RPC12/RpoP
METFFINLSITVLAYFAVPFIMLYKGKTYSLKKIKRIVIINGICVFLLFFLFHLVFRLTLNTNTNANPTAAFLWSMIAYKILKKSLCNPDDSLTETYRVTSNYEDEEKEVFTDTCKDHPNDNDDRNTPTIKEISSVPEQEPKLPKAIFCKMCGGKVDNDTRQCTSCGKQYFKPPKINLTPAYCKKCGSKVDSSTGQCTSCGKQYFKTPTINLTPNYCKKCGGKINKETSRCTSCNKKYHKLFKTKLVLIFFLCLILLFSGYKFLTKDDVYIRIDSNYYHQNADCFFLGKYSYSVVTIEEAENSGKIKCPYCY